MIQIYEFVCLFGESRTLTPSLAQEPKSCLSTNSNTKRFICIFKSIANIPNKFDISNGKL